MSDAAHVHNALMSLHLVCRAERGPGNPDGYGLRTHRVRRLGIRSGVVPGRARRACARV